MIQLPVFTGAAGEGGAAFGAVTLPPPARALPAAPL